jgi:hypothetical protein
MLIFPGDPILEALLRPDWQQSVEARLLGNLSQLIFFRVGKVIFLNLNARVGAYHFHKRSSEKMDLILKYLVG